MMRSDTDTGLAERERCLRILQRHRDFWVRIASRGITDGVIAREAQAFMAELGNIMIEIKGK